MPSAYNTPCYTHGKSSCWAVAWPLKGEVLSVLWISASTMKCSYGAQPGSRRERWWRPFQAWSGGEERMSWPVQGRKGRTPGTCCPSAARPCPWLYVCEVTVCVDRDGWIGKSATCPMSIGASVFARVGVCEGRLQGGVCMCSLVPGERCGGVSCVCVPEDG